MVLGCSEAPGPEAGELPLVEWKVLKGSAASCALPKAAEGTVLLVCRLKGSVGGRPCRCQSGEPMGQGEASRHAQAAGQAVGWRPPLPDTRSARAGPPSQGPWSQSHEAL